MPLHQHIIRRFVAALFIASLVPAAAAQSQSQSSYTGERTSPLPPEQVFVVSAESVPEPANMVRVVYQMPPDFYLYRERFALNIAAGDVQMGDVQFPPAQTYDDPFFGRTEIYRDGVTLQVATTGDGEFALRVISQGCDALLGICYPPQIHTARMQTGGGAAVISYLSAVDLSADNGNLAAVGDDEAAVVAQLLSDSTLWQILATFFTFGLLLSFTPCVLPMLPILLGIISGASNSANGGASGRANSNAPNGKKSAAALTLAYIGGVCAAYTALGVAAGLSGQLFLPFLQSPPALIITAVIFCLLALSMFGWFEIQMPARLRSVNFGGGGTLGGALVMGALSAAIVSPCVAAPLIGALIYIGRSGDAVLGGLALLSLSLGMSALLAAAGIGGMALPRGGAWMQKVRQLSGVLLLAVAVWVLSALLPGTAVVLLYGALGVLGGVLLAAPFKSNTTHHRKPLAVRAASIVLLLWGGVMLVGGAGGARDPLSPLSVFRDSTAAAETSPLFAPVQTAAETRQLVRQSGRAGMLEFYADWCVSCKEMERFTFADSQVRTQLSSMTLLRADVTQNNSTDRALMQAFNVYGPPAIIFFAANGDIIANVRVNGYQSAARFLQALAAAKHAATVG